MNNQTYDLSYLYSLRQDFVVIGLTGRLGSGSSYICNEFLSQPNFEWAPLPNNSNNSPLTNDDRKFKIAYNFLKSNWGEGFIHIKYSDVILLMLFREFGQYEPDFDKAFEVLCNFVENDYECLTLGKKINIEISHFKEEAIELNKLKPLFQKLYNQMKEKNLSDITSLNSRINDQIKLDLYELFFESNEFQELKLKFNTALSINNLTNRSIILNVLCNRFRSRECIYCVNNDKEFPYIYSVADIINHLVKSIRHVNGKCRVVIDSFRNPLEIRYFKERYSGFYPVAIHSDDEYRKTLIEKSCESKNHGKCSEYLIALDNIESESPEGKFYMQDVQKCLQIADLHLFNDESLSKQIVCYIALMLHPGLIPASQVERIMQIAYTAKYNSGCISRQVGAAICDNNFSIRSVGWNNPPQHHVPCSLRNAQDLLNGDDSEAFTPLELKKGEKIHNVVKDNYGKVNFKEHNCSFCFKQVQNSIKEGKNQVHTRSLHAEENAMLQLVKNGGAGLEGGFLFTTASPCELCAKKAYQLGIKRIYFIDPYPGISKEQILTAGPVANHPVMLQFNGAIGQTYFKLYEPYMAHKDEISLRFGINIEDENKKLKSKIAEIENENEFLRSQNASLLYCPPEYKGQNGPQEDPSKCCP